MLWKGFQRPKRLEFERETATERFGRFYAQPFERGFGTTIGNTLRRVLLSSIEGAAVTAVKIDGVQHEFSPIPGVVEDATDVVLNLKQIPIEMHTDEVKTLYVRVDRPGPVRARDIEVDQDVEILEPDAHIATVAEKGKLHMELRVKRGRGYVSADKNFDEDLGIGWIPVDSVHSPVKKVNYLVEAARVGQNTDYDKLTMDVWTNGAVSPTESVALAARLLRLHLDIFVSVSETNTDDDAEPGDVDARRGQREPRQERRGARAVGALLQLPQEREHPHAAGARDQDRGGHAQDQELRPQVAERDQGNPRGHGPEPRHALRSGGSARRRSSARQEEYVVMRHRVAHRKLGRVTEHRISLLRNQATALLRHEHIETTVPKARELRPFVERLITVAKRGIAAGDAEKKLMNARRHVARDLADVKVVGQAVRRGRAALRDAARRLHAPAQGRTAPGRQRRHGPHRAGRQRVQPEPRGRGREPPRRRRPPASAAGCRPPRAACAASSAAAADKQVAEPATAEPKKRATKKAKKTDE